MSNHPAAGAIPAGISSIRLSASFRRQILKMLASILLFIITYLVLLITAIVLAIACVWAGGWLISTASGIFSFFLGIGIIIPGVMQVVFLVKFLFSRQRRAYPLRIKLEEQAQPELYAFIRTLTKATSNRFPKNIFLSEDVNAAVFYEPGLLSLLLPGRKSMEIGMGLVNSLNVSELGMVLSHEFGHFSQRSMQLGAYVVSVNKVIYNILYENTGWNKTIIWLSQHGAILNIFARISIAMASGVQFILRQLYSLVNKQYMSLSREMEFHADAVALAISGTQTAMSTMRRVELSGTCFQNCLQQVQLLVKDKRHLQNIYEGHRVMIRDYAAEYQLPLDATGLPIITDPNFQSVLKGRVQFRNQWASHPTLEEREARYREADIPSVQITDSAWTLFRNATQLQEELSGRIYEIFFPEQALEETYPIAAFAAALAERRRLYAFPPVFDHYYERQFPPVPRDLTPLTTDEMATLSLAALYAPEHVQRLRIYYRDVQDAETLRAISEKQLQTRYFELEGQQHAATEAAPLLALLEAALYEEAAVLQAHDNLAFRYHYTKAGALAPKVLSDYQQIYAHQHRYVQLNHSFANVMQSMNSLFSEKNITLQMAQPFFDILHQESATLRKLLGEIPDLYEQWGNGLPEKIRQFLNSRYTYLQDTRPLMNEIGVLHDICVGVPEQYQSSILLLQKDWLMMVESL